MVSVAAMCAGLLLANLCPVGSATRFDELSADEICAELQLVVLCPAVPAALVLEAPAAEMFAEWSPIAEIVRVVSFLMVLLQ